MKSFLWLTILLCINVNAQETKDKDIFDKIIESITNCYSGQKQSLNARQNMRRHKSNHPFY
jgi:hypothetical protein